MKVQVTIARSQREYADPIVEAPSVEIAEAYVEQLLKQETDEATDMLNAVHWNTGDESFDEDVIDASECEDDDEADVTVPADFVPPPAQPDAPPADQFVWVLTTRHRHGADVGVYATAASARAGLADFCRQFWHEVALGDEADEAEAAQTPPEDDDEAIRIYYERQEASSDPESYELEQAKVLP